MMILCDEPRKEWKEREGTGSREGAPPMLKLVFIGEVKLIECVYSAALTGQETLN